MPREAKLYPDAVPVVGLIACTALALSLAPDVIIAGLAVLAAGLLIRLVTRRRHPAATT